jgi:hypothetical protein
MAGMEVHPQGREPVMPYYIALTSYISFGLMYIFGHARDLWRSIVGGSAGGGGEAARKGYAPLCKDYEDFYTRRMYMRIHDVFNRPIASAPDAWIDVVERVAEPGGRASAQRLRCTAATRRCLNLGSYNYLGFAAADPYCTQRVRAGCVALAEETRLAAAGALRRRLAAARRLCRAAPRSCAWAPRSRAAAACKAAWACGSGDAAAFESLGRPLTRRAPLAPRRAAPATQVLDALLKHGASTCRHARAARWPPRRPQPACQRRALRASRSPLR